MGFMVLRQMLRYQVLFLGLEDSPYRTPFRTYTYRFPFLEVRHGKRRVKTVVFRAYFPLKRYGTDQFSSRAELPSVPVRTEHGLVFPHRAIFHADKKGPGPARPAWSNISMRHLRRRLSLHALGFSTKVLWYSILSAFSRTILFPVIF